MKKVKNYVQIFFYNSTKSHRVLLFFITLSSMVFKMSSELKGVACELQKTLNGKRDLVEAHPAL